MKHEDYLNLMKGEVLSSKRKTNKKTSELCLSSLSLFLLMSIHTLLKMEDFAAFDNHIPLKENCVMLELLLKFDT